MIKPFFLGRGDLVRMKPVTGAHNGIGRTWLAIIVFFPLLMVVFGGGLAFGKLDSRTAVLKRDLNKILAQLETNQDRTSAILERVITIEAKLNSPP